jgi:hypothetical protein
MLDKLGHQVQLTISSSAPKISPNNGSTFSRKVVMVFMHIQSLHTILYLICLASNNLGSVYSNAFLFLGSWSQYEVGCLQCGLVSYSLFTLIIWVWKSALLISLLVKMLHVHIAHNRLVQQVQSYGLIVGAW